MCIAHWLDDGSKFEWSGVMKDLGDALAVMSIVASTVVNTSAVAEEDKFKGKVKWIAEVEIQLMPCLFSIFQNSQT